MAEPKLSLPEPGPEENYQRRRMAMLILKHLKKAHDALSEYRAGYPSFSRGSQVPQKMIDTHIGIGQEMIRLQGEILKLT